MRRGSIAVADVDYYFYSGRREEVSAAFYAAVAQQSGREGGRGRQKTHLPSVNLRAQADSCL